jgi:prepilin-type N-terminal cleavage/methylation domain-containing protein
MRIIKKDSKRADDNYMKLRIPLLKSQGFSLVEMMVVVGILSVVAVGTSMQLISIFKDQIRLQSKSNMVQTNTLISKAFGKRSKTSVAARSCAQTLIAPNGFDKNGDTDVQLQMSAAELYTEGSTIAGTGNFTINKLYLSDVVSLAPDRPDSYLTNLYIVADVGPADAPLRTKPRSIATVVVTLNPNANTIKSCDVGVTTPTAKETCTAIDGMHWDETLVQCEQDIALDTNHKFEKCLDGTKRIGGVCIPSASGCGPGQVAAKFDRGQVQACATPPLNPAIGRPTQSVPTAVEGVPNQPPPLVSNPGTLSPPVTTAPIPSTAPPTTAASCAAPNSLGTATFDYCIGISSCQAQMPGMIEADGSCVATIPVTYSTPPPAATPSPAPPADYTCQCNSARIANGAYCSYCVRDVDLGYGFVDYAYGVSQCQGGNLVPVSTTSFDTSTCGGGYAPTKYINSTFQQYRGYGHTQIQ